MGSLAGNEERADDLRFIQSSADTKIVALKRELVVQLFTQDGPFWEAVRDVRDRWGVEASAQLPPHPVHWTLSPPGLPDPQKELEEWLDTSEAWSKDLESIARSVIPERYIGNKFRPDWGSFVSACVWCDPPARPRGRGPRRASRVPHEATGVQAGREGSLRQALRSGAR